MGEVSNRLSRSWQMHSDVPPPLTPLSFSRIIRKDHTSVASWSAFPFPASISSDLAGLGVNCFGYFPRKESNSAAGPKPGIYQRAKLSPLFSGMRAEKP